MVSNDVVIVGGGPVGLTLAAALVSAMDDLNIVICDRRPIAVPDDARASAISAGVSQVFEGLGLWAQMQEAATPIRRMEITDSGSGDLARPLFLSFEGDVAPGRPYAHMVPNTVMAEALLQRIEGKVRFMAPVTISGWSASASAGTLTFDDGETLSAPLIVAADGARSALRGMAGIETLQHDYAQMGIVTTISHEIDHQGTAYEHFRPAGPFASLPLPQSRSSLVWTESVQEAQRLLALPKDALASEIEQAMGACLGHVEVVDKVQAFPLQLQIARDFIGPRLALIGDAAHVVHPIAGQGLNLGLKDVAALAEVVIEAIRLGQDHGTADVLEGYQRWRRFDTALMAMATDGLNRLFSNDLGVARAVRDLGLGLVDRAPVVKSQLIRHAAGIGPGPRLLHGEAL